MISLDVIDYHVGGESLRIVRDVLSIPGRTMEERRLTAEASLGAVRRFVAGEPRGHMDMFGVLLTPPVARGSAFGALFFDGESFKTACGHGSMALVSAAVEEGWIRVEADEPVFLDVPAGRVRVDVRMEGKRVVEVVYHHVPSRLLARDVELPTRIGPLKADIVLAGPPIVLIDLEQTKLRPGRADLDALRSLHADLRTLALPPGIADGEAVDMVQFYRDRRASEAGVVYETLTFFGNGSYDRSPCGVATSARLAQLQARGRLAPGGVIRAVSLTRSRFIASIGGLVPTEEGEAVEPVIRARAFRTGCQRLALEDDDPSGAEFRSALHWIESAFIAPTPAATGAFSREADTASREENM